MMVNLRNLLANIKNGWNNLRLSLKPYLNYGQNRCSELVTICSGVFPTPGPEQWKRNFFTLYRFLSYYQFMVSLAKIGFGIRNPEDFVGLCASVLVTSVMVIDVAKLHILDHHREVIQQSRDFVGSNFSHSGDPDYDASVRKDAANRAGKLTLVVFLMLCSDQVMLTVPNSARDQVMGIPEQFHELGSMAGIVLQETYVFMIVVVWGSRYFCYSLTVLPVLLGLRSELMIVARGFQTMENRMQAQIQEDLENSVEPSQESLGRALKWKHLQHTVESNMKQQVEVLRNMKLMQSPVSNLYAITYYSSTLIISIPVLLVLKGGITFISVSLVFGASVILAECYWWCHLIDSIKGIMESIAECAAQLGTGLEHSSEHHSEYTQMRTSLMIIALNLSQKESFSCGGIFPISVESFGDLCMIIYRSATFLLNCD